MCHGIIGSVLTEIRRQPYQTPGTLPIADGVLIKTRHLYSTRSRTLAPLCVNFEVAPCM